MLVATTGCERADQAVTSEPLPEPIRVVAPPAPKRVEPPKPAVSMPAPEINPRERAAPVPRRKRATWFSQLTVEERSAVRGICKAKQENPCVGMLPMPVRRDGGPPERHPIEGLYAKLQNQEIAKVERFCQVNYKAGVCDTPLVIAFDAQPIELAPATTAAFAFRPGSPSSTDWPTATTPWLALDRDGNGAIDSGAELFGDSTAMPDGARAANGFAALAALDANRDGVIDRRDPMFAALLLWTDRDGDHASSPDELSPAASVLVEIPLSYRRDARCDDRGNCEGERSSMTWRDGNGAIRIGSVVDLYLRSR